MMKVITEARTMNSDFYFDHINPQFYNDIGDRNIYKDHIPKGAIDILHNFRGNTSIDFTKTQLNAGVLSGVCPDVGAAHKCYDGEGGDNAGVVKGERGAIYTSINAHAKLVDGIMCWVANLKTSDGVLSIDW